MKACVAFVFALIVSLPVHAVIMVNDEFTVNFSDPNSIREHGVIWTPHEKIQQTDKGLLFSDPSDATSVDFGLMTKPYAIGLSWRPTYSVNLDVELSPLDEEKPFSGGTLHPSLYTVYVRYSPDMKTGPHGRLCRINIGIGKKEKKSASINIMFSCVYLTKRENSTTTIIDNI